MREETACSILKLIGIITILVGATLTAQALIAWSLMSRAVSGNEMELSFGVSGLVGDVARFAILPNVVTIGMGVLLGYLSPRLARFVVDAKTPS